jgi:outer membrane protein TolC
MMLFGLLGLFAAASVQADTLDFRQCVAEALRNNPEMAIGRAQIEQADSAIRGAEGSRMPRLNLSLTATRTNDPLNAFGLKLGQASVTGDDFIPDTLNDPSAINNFNTRIEIQAPLYTGGQLTAQIEQTKALAEAVRRGDEAARQRLIRMVGEAYQGVHTARAYRQVAEQGREAAKEYLRVSDRLHKAGMAVKSDLLSARVNLEDAQLRVSDAERMESTALDRLKLLLGRPLGDSLEVGTPLQTAPQTVGETALVELARQQHPALAALRSQADANRAQVDAARAGSLPQLSALARQDWNDDNLGTDADSYTLAGVLSWQAFDGGVTRAAMDRAEAGRSETLARLRQAEDGIIFEVRDALRRGQEAEQRLAAREAAVKDAEEAQRLSKKRYENGLTTLVDLLSVQTQLDKARADLVAARHALEVSRIDQKRAAGILTPDTL